jgi:dihydroorotate dehydrogenase electron transfer subunit
MRDRSLEVLGNHEIPGGFRELVLAAEHFEDAAPGQFVNIACGAGGPLLRRPFSIYKAGGGRLAVLFRVVGEGTRMLAAARPGDFLEVLGPLGNGFPAIDGPVVLVGGGIGVPPIAFLAQRLAPGQVAGVALGFRNSGEILIEEDFAKHTRQLVIATDDGSRGIHGTVLDALVAAVPEPPYTLAACGPHGMLKALKEWAAVRRLRCLVSLEAMMGCGYGVCLGCAVPAATGPDKQCGIHAASGTHGRAASDQPGPTPSVATGGYLHVCSEGPVFEAGEVVL